MTLPNTMTVPNDTGLEWGPGVNATWGTPEMVHKNGPVHIRLGSCAVYNPPPTTWMWQASIPGFGRGLACMTMVEAVAYIVDQYVRCEHELLAFERPPHHDDQDNSTRLRYTTALDHLTTYAPEYLQDILKKRTRRAPRPHDL